MFVLFDSIMYWSDDVFGSGSIVQVSLLELEALSAVWARVVYLDAILHRLAADKGFVFLSLLLLELIIYSTVKPTDSEHT